MNNAEFYNMLRQRADRELELINELKTQKHDIEIKIHSTYQQLEALNKILEHEGEEPVKIPDREALK